MNAIKLTFLSLLLVGCTTTHHMQVSGTGVFAPIARMVAEPAVQAHGVVCEGARYERREVVARAYERNGRRPNEYVRVRHDCVVPRY